MPSIASPRVLAYASNMSAKAQAYFAAIFGFIRPLFIPRADSVTVAPRSAASAHLFLMWRTSGEYLMNPRTEYDAAV